MKSYTRELDEAEKNFCYNVSQLRKFHGYETNKELYDELIQGVPDDMFLTYRYFLQLIGTPGKRKLPLNWMLYISEYFEVNLDALLTQRLEIINNKTLRTEPIRKKLIAA